MSVTLRPAVPDDAPAIARICLAAGGGSFEYLYDGLQPGTNAESVLAALTAMDTTPYSYRNFTIAESGGEIAGGVNAVSVPGLKEAEEATLPALAHSAGLRPWALIRYATRRTRLGLRLRGQMPDLDSLILANVAVFPGHTGQGIGAALVQHVIDRATEEGFPSVNLVVWDSNDRARALYERLGFKLADTAPFKPLRNIRYRARCLMVREVT